MNSPDFVAGAIKPVECLKEAWRLIKPQYWILFAAAVIGLILSGITLYVLLGSMLCGIYHCYLQAIDGKKVELDGLFKNVKSYFLPSLPVIILFVAPMIIVFGIIYVPFLLTIASGEAMSEEALIASLTAALAVDFVVIIIMTCLHTLLMFSFPLIVDRNLSGWQAIKLSAKSVWRNLSGVTGIWALMFLVNFVGLLAFCVGVYLTIPILLATQTVAYRKVFPKLNEEFDAPPPPNAYNL